MGRVLTNGREGLLRKILIILVILIVAARLITAGSIPSKAVDRARSKTEMTGFVTCVKAYLDEYPALPSGGDAAVLKALQGENPRKIVFFVLRSTSFNSNGEWIDPWGTPYRIDLSDPKAPRIWSCGPNRKDESGAEGSDDIVSWR